MCALTCAGFDEKLGRCLGGLSEQILVIDDYRDSKKDKQMLLKLLQPQGLTFKNTVWDGNLERERTIENRPWPVVIFTTRDDAVLENEGSRFLSLRADESTEQTLAIVKTRAQGLKPVAYDQDIALWEEATSVLVIKKGDFDKHPAWLTFVAEQLPVKT